MDRLINMILRQIIRRLVNKGLRAGFRKTSSRRKSDAGPNPAPERQEQIRQAAKALRRTTRR